MNNDEIRLKEELKNLEEIIRNGEFLILFTDFLRFRDLLEIEKYK
jgi:hypothetical protein